ncbi:hypothetical protein [Mycolicibacter algericus]|uniref:Uncharacterized protein n=2 Tax=Mycolicibacter algericus TaxID=1288388 RepID=A0A7I9YDY6_MYCAL|nr:hypothetical protein [Mycolicibacter algericus]OQZ93654.1 hypothetical protein BST10_19985 [Mycolicibacter algericus DSM 45454]GFG86915.1 hypothetical protein MALGJ_35910 [Mycolicibacter algericus]
MAAPDQHQTPIELIRVVLLGDHRTAERIEMLEDIAAQHDVDIAAVYSFEPGEAAGCHELAEIDALVSALGSAITIRLPIWMPYPCEDLGLEQHFRRLGLVLQRHGLNLLTGADLTPCPTGGGMSEIDFALRAEVWAVDNLDGAALAVAGAQTLGRAIEDALAAAAPRGNQDDSEAPAKEARRRPVWPNEEAVKVVATETGMEIEVSPLPTLPAPHAPWAQREPVLRRYAMWLTRNCGLTQAAAAQCLNPTGHRTPQGCLWRQATVSALLNGRYGRAPGSAPR